MSHALSGRVPLNEAQRRALSIRLRSIAERLRSLRELGVESVSLDDLEAAIGEVGADLALTVEPAPAPTPSALLLRVLILLEEIEPRQLSAYGPLDPLTEAYLEPVVQRLTTLATELQRDLGNCQRGENQARPATDRPPSSKTRRE